MMEKIASRAFPAFAIGFALYYAPGYAFTGANSSFSWPLFTYFPAVDQWAWGLVPGSDDLGPPMWWYGWIAAAVLVGLVFAAVAMLIPEKSTEKLWSKAIFVVPIVMFVFLLNWEMSWFIPGWQPLSIASMTNPAPANQGPPQGPPPPAE
jgi:hypothetical protein